MCLNSSRDGVRPAKTAFSACDADLGESGIYPSCPGDIPIEELLESFFMNTIFRERLQELEIPEENLHGKKLFRSEFCDLSFNLRKRRLNLHHSSMS